LANVILILHHLKRSREEVGFFYFNIPAGYMKNPAFRSQKINRVFSKKPDLFTHKQAVDTV
jgi:hypothetical protein